MARYKFAATGWKLVQKGEVLGDPHECPLPSPPWEEDFGVGAVVECQECGQQWIAKYNPYATGRWTWVKKWLRVKRG